MPAPSSRDAVRRSLVSRLKDGLTPAGDGRPHVVVCGSDPLVYTLAEELSNAGHRIRVTVVVPRKLRADVPDLAALHAVRVVRVERFDERALRSAGLAGAAALALVLPDDMANLHAALCAQAVEKDLRLVIRMFNAELGYGVRQLFTDCAVLSDAAMAAPAFVAAALGEVAPTHFRHARRTLYVARREDVHPRDVVCTLTGATSDGQVAVLPAEPAPRLSERTERSEGHERRPDRHRLSERTERSEGHERRPDRHRPTDLVLAEATGKPSGAAAAAQRIVRTRRRRRPFLAIGRAVRAALSRKLGVAVLVTLVVTAVSGTVLAHADRDVRGFWQSVYLTLLTAVGSSDVEIQRSPVAQGAQLVLTLSGLALLPLITAAVVDGVVNARLALTAGRVRTPHADHVVLVGLGNVGTRVLRQLTDLGIEVVAIDLKADAFGARVAQQLRVPFIVGDAAREETLRAASIDTCQALVVVSTDDVTNLQAALHARAVRDDLRVVLRLFDSDFALRVQKAFNIGTSRSVSYLAAPAFAAAMLDRDVIATIPVDRHALLVAEVQVLTASPLAGAPLRRADRALSVRVIGLRPAGSDQLDWTPDLTRTLAPGDKVLVVARRAGLRALLEQATPAPVPVAPGESRRP